MIAHGQFVVWRGVRKVQCSEIRIVDWSLAHRACVFKICQMALRGSAYSDVFALLAAGWQAECVLDSKLGCVILVCVRLVFLKATLKGL